MIEVETNIYRSISVISVIIFIQLKSTYMSVYLNYQLSSSWIYIFKCLTHKWRLQVSSNRVEWIATILSFLSNDQHCTCWLVLLMLVLLQIVWRMPGLSEEENWKSGSLRLCHSQFRYGEHQHHITSHYTQHTAQGTPPTFTAQLRVVTRMPTHPLQLQLSLRKVTS